MFDIREKLGAFRDAIISEEVDNLGGDDSITTENKIIAHVEALEEQVERVRWHYPDKGELPEVGRVVIAEDSAGITKDHYGISSAGYTVWIYDGAIHPDECAVHHVCDFQFRFWVTRWRYI